MDQPTKCSFIVGDVVRFTPKERTKGQYQNIERFGVKIGQDLPITNVKDDTYLYFENDIGGWSWTEFTLVRRANVT